MKKDIEVPEVKNVYIAVVKQSEEFWSINLINRTEHLMENTLLVSNGYGEHEGEEVKTSTLRHSLGTIEPNSATTIENIDPQLFHLTHEYWLTFYSQGKIYDKKFIFKPDTISEENLSYIKELDKKGVMH